MTISTDHRAATSLPGDHGDGQVSPSWVAVVAADRVPHDRGVAVMVDGAAIALFRLSPSDGRSDDEWYAVDHLDPVRGVPVMARGLIGSTEIDGVETATVASPLHKERYDLRTGQQIDDGAARLGVHPVRVADGIVEIGRVDLT